MVQGTLKEPTLEEKKSPEYWWLLLPAATAGRLEFWVEIRPGGGQKVASGGSLRMIWEYEMGLCISLKISFITDHSK